MSTIQDLQETIASAADRVGPAVVGFDLPRRGCYATGLVFLSTEPAPAARARAVVEKSASAAGARALGWRDVPVDPTGLGRTAVDAMTRSGSRLCSAR